MKSFKYVLIGAVILPAVAMGSDPVTCTTTVAAAQATCTLTAISSAALGLINSFNSSTDSGDIKGACKASAGLNELGAAVNAGFSVACGSKALTAYNVCNVWITQACASTYAGTPPPGPSVAPCIARAKTLRLTAVGFGIMAGAAGFQSISQLAAFAKSKTCEKELDSGKDCKTIADYDTKPQCRFELCPNISSVPGLTQEQIQARIDQAIAELRTRGPASEITSADRTRICTVAARDCSSAQYRNDTQCLCERDPTREGCRTTASGNSNTPTGGGSPSGGGPQFAGGGGAPGSGPGGNGGPGFDVPGGGPGSEAAFLGANSNNRNRNSSGGLSGTAGSGGGAAGSGSGGGGSGGLAGAGSRGGGVSEDGSSSQQALAGRIPGEGAQEGEGASGGGSAFASGDSSGGGSSGRGGVGYGSGAASARGVAGLSVNHGQDRIGVAGDNMFMMIERQYKAQRGRGQFLETPNPPPQTTPPKE